MLRTPARAAAVVLAGCALGAGCIQRSVECPPANGGGATAAQAPPVNLASAKKASVLDASGVKAFSVHGDTDKVATTVVAVQGQPFTEAVRAQVNKGSGHEWAVQLQTPTSGAVEDGDVLLATFYLRTEKALEDIGAGQTQFVFEQSKDPYTKSVVYDVQAGPEWRKITVPFVAKQKFGAGDAQMIFRLGYDPETIDIAGVTVEDYGKGLAVNSLPTTPAWSPPHVAVAASNVVTDGGPLAITIDATKPIGPISPYVYGINSQDAPGVGETVRRMGGNRQTGYNWEKNASNAGSDYHHVSDDWPCTSLGYTNCDEPGAQFLDFAAADRKIGAESLAVIPLVDFVAADKKHEVADDEKAPSKRWVKSLPNKKGAYSMSPDLNDGVVYEDEFVHFLVKKLGDARHGGIKFYEMDNEPALWPSTHPRIHPAKTTYRELVSRSEALGAAITTIDPTALVLGGSLFGWSEYLNESDAPDSKEYNAKYDTFVDYFLASMKELEDKHHRRLMHVFDVHWYPEAKGTKRITDDDDSPKTVDARLQAPRELWDPSYREKSWIDDSLGKSIRLVPWLKEKIEKRYPGTKLSMTEYDFGGAKHVSGGLAQIDVLGALGREGVFLANYWGNGPGNGELPPYIASAFKMYRNYDGNGGAYGDTAVTAAVPDATKASVYAAVDAKRPDVLTVIVINKDQSAKYAGKMTVRSPKHYTSAQTYVVDKSSSQIHAGPTVEIHDDVIDYALPPLSATLFVCKLKG